MDARSALIVVAVLLLTEVGNVASRPVPSGVSQHSPPLPGSTCSCGNATIVCGEITTAADKWVPWLSCAISVILFLVPANRVLRTLGHRSKSHTLFWWFLLLSFLNYNVWFRYSMGCHNGQSTFPIYLTSCLGMLIHVALLTLSVGMILPNKVKVRRVNAGIILTLVLWGVIFYTPLSLNGWLGLALGVLAHLFRMKATVYDQFNCLLFAASVLGATNGFVWLYHPNLCIARHYKIASYIIGILRGWEVFVWCSPGIATALWKLEGAEAAERDD